MTTTTTTGIVHELNLEKQIEKQMGCMTGFLQLFDRNQILSGKRLYSTKRLPPPPVVDVTSEQEMLAVVSPCNLREPGKAKRQSPPSPERLKHWPVADLPSTSALPFPMFELKEGAKSSWKLCKETPRLSLDSRATTDTKGGLHPKEILLNASTIPAANGVVHDAVGGQLQRSPSVIAKLMGLEPLPNSSSIPEPEKKAQLGSSSESRRLFHSRLIMEGNDFHLKQPSQSHSSIFNNAVKESAALEDSHYAGSRSYLLKDGNKAEPTKVLSSTGGVNLSPWKVPQHRKSYFDSAEIFPEPKQNVPIYGEIERRLKMRGIEEPSKDLDTLKNILEALQLKGLLHSSSTKPSEQNQIPHRNFVHDESRIVLMKPSLSTMTSPVNRRTESEFSPLNGRSQSRCVRQNYNTAIENLSPLIPRRERNVQNPSQSECNSSARRLNSQVKSKTFSVETQRRANELIDNRRASPIHSPKLNTRRIVPESHANNRHPRSKKTMVKDHEKDNITILVPAEDESSSISGSSISTSTDSEKPKTEEHKQGKTLLDRCDKLLHSIAEMTTAIDMQPSPVSVLDSSLYKDDSFTPSPITNKHDINLKDQSANLEEELWSPMTSSIGLKCLEISEDSDFLYISDILSASHLFPDESDIFLLLEKQQYLKGKDSSKLSRLQRKLIFDTITEILNRIRRLPPWQIVSWTNYDVNKNPPVNKIWLEFQRIREQDAAEDLFETICCVLKKDLARDTITGWGDCPIEISEVVLDIERLIFKDLITETIRDLAALASARTFSIMARRKLVF